MKQDMIDTLDAGKGVAITITDGEQLDKVWLVLFKYCLAEYDNMVDYNLRQGNNLNMVIRKNGIDNNVVRLNPKKEPNNVEWYVLSEDGNDLVKHEETYSIGDRFVYPCDVGKINLNDCPVFTLTKVYVSNGKGGNDIMVTLTDNDGDTFSYPKKVDNWRSITKSEFESIFEQYYKFVKVDVDINIVRK